MFYKNARIYCADHTFHTGAFEVTKDGLFGAVLPENVPEDAIDLCGAAVIPGLVDVHIHGCMGADFSDGDYEGLKNMARHLLKEGITSFAPASMTLPYDVLEKAFATGRRLADEAPEDCARLMGIHMEGPYFSEKKKGAQNGAYLKNPDIEGFRMLQESCGGLVRIVDVAPELPGTEEFVKEASKLCTVSVAHTDSDYDHAKMAFDNGATHLTHTFNAMSPIAHRAPGVIPAAAENKAVRAELIGDAFHVMPPVVRLIFSVFGPERMIIVSDALRCCGMPKGQYELGGQIVVLEDVVGRLLDGTVAGSITNLYTCMQRMMECGIPEEDVIRACTHNPACAIAADSKIGTIETGKYADFIVCTENYATKRVFRGGKEVQ